MVRPLAFRISGNHPCGANRADNRVTPVVPHFRGFINDNANAMTLTNAKGRHHPKGQ